MPDRRNPFEGVTDFVSELVPAALPRRARHA